MGRYGIRKIPLHGANLGLRSTSHQKWGGKTSLCRLPGPSKRTAPLKLEVSPPPLTLSNKTPAAEPLQAALAARSAGPKPPALARLPGPYKIYKGQIYKGQIL